MRHFNGFELGVNQRTQKNTQLSNTQDLELGTKTGFDENSGISSQSLKLENKEAEEGEAVVEAESISGESKDVSKELIGSSTMKRVELVHPWPEWIELMERLVQQNYFDHRRKDEDKMIQELGFNMGDVATEESFDFTGDHKKIVTACLNFGKDRFDILRSLSRQDIQILVGYGCPSVDRRLVLSAKVLRKHAHLDEGDVCSSCNLRSSCEKAYLLTNKEDEARTVDIMRVLATFGLDHTHGLVANKSLLKEKSVKTVIRKLLHEVVKLSAVPIDPNLPPPIIKKPPPKVKQPPPAPKKRVGRDDIEMKKGDWLCPKCNFMNFAKNTVCLQCDAKRPKRELLPGEWECPECNFLNYRRNTVCFHCECKRPPDQSMEERLHERQHNPRMKLERVNRQDVSNAWNFDFDDDESDGADVAAFEYGDSSMKSKDSPFQGHDQGRIYGPEETIRSGRWLDKREYSESENKRSRMGFDDFDDEEDDVDSYELDRRNDNSVQNRRDFSDIEEKTELEDDDFDNELNHRQTKPLSSRRPSRPMRQKAAFGGSEDDDDFDSDDEASVLPEWRSSHVTDYRQSGSRGLKVQSRGLTYGSDEEIGLDSDEEDDIDENFGSRKGNSNKLSSKRDFQKRQRSALPSDSDSDSDYMMSSYGSRSVGKKRNGRGKNSKGYDSHAQSISRGRGGRRDPWDDDFDRSPRESRGNDRGSRTGNSRDNRIGHQGGGSRNFGAPRTEEFGGHRNGRFSKYGKEKDGGFDDFRNMRRVIER